MQEGFIRGGAGEVRLQDILPAQLRGASTRAEKETFAAAYEEKHPNVLVVRDWETISDETIEEYRRMGRDSQADQALADRLALENRRANRKVTISPTRTTGMDPERARKELRRAYVNIHGLDPAHPEYDKLWTNWTREANNYEEMCGLPKTKFTKGLQPRKNDDPIPKELQEKLNKYIGLPDRKRRELVGEMKNADLLRLVRDNEPLPEVQMLAVERLAQVGAL